MQRSDQLLGGRALHNFGQQLFGQLQRSAAVAGLADDLEIRIGLYQRLQPGEHHRIIVHNRERATGIAHQWQRITERPRPSRLPSQAMTPVWSTTSFSDGAETIRTEQRAAMARDFAFEPCASELVWVLPRTRQTSCRLRMSTLARRMICGRYIRLSQFGNWRIPSEDDTDLPGSLAPSVPTVTRAEPHDRHRIPACSRSECLTLPVDVTGQKNSAWPYA